MEPVALPTLHSKYNIPSFELHAWLHLVPLRFGPLSPFYPRVLSLASECSTPSEASTERGNCPNEGVRPQSLVKPSHWKYVCAATCLQEWNSLDDVLESNSIP